MADEDDPETITVADVSDGVGGDEEPDQSVDLPVVELLTGRGFVTGKSGSGKSVLEGTPVYTEDGRAPIESVTEGQRVLSLNRHTYEAEFREVLGTLEHTAENLLRIELEDGTELVGTEDHSFLTVEDMEIVPVQGSEVEPGTWMPLARELPSTGTVERIDLAEYVDEDDLASVSASTITSGSKEGDRYLDPTFETGVVLGLYLAEGALDSKKTVQISNVDDDVARFLEDQGFKTYERTNDRAFKPFGRFLEQEFGTGSESKRVPEWVYDGPDAFRAGVVSGYFDGDGTVGETSATAMSKSTELLTGIKELLQQFGVHATLREKFVLYDGERRQYHRLTVDSGSLPRFAGVVDLVVERKAAALADAVETLESGQSYESKDMVPNFGSVLTDAARERGWNERDGGRRAGASSIHQATRKGKTSRETYNRYVDELDLEGRAKRFGESDIHWRRVVSVEPLDEERRVYDLDVELNDNFVANGAFVHNSNTASVVVENLLDEGLPVMILDQDGEYYGLKEEYEVLHAGADDECDIVVSPEHASKLAELALNGNVPVVLDLSGYLDEDVASKLVLNVARQLFAKEKKLKKPFLLLVEECHEFIPESAGLGETGKMLIKIGKRGRKHGLGIVGISQRPADVKKDFITQCDWLVWHRLTWKNDTKVVRRILGSDYADAVEDLGDGEAFLTSDWTGDIRRVQFHRKETFDAGATPGLEDVSRPDLKSVSDDLVDELRDISDEQERRESELADLRQELERKDKKIDQLKAELEEARDLKRMADRFSQALLDRADAPHRRVEAGAGGGTGYPGSGPTTADESGESGEPTELSGPEAGEWTAETRREDESVAPDGREAGRADAAAADHTTGNADGDAGRAGDGARDDDGPEDGPNPTFPDGEAYARVVGDGDRDRDRSDRPVEGATDAEVAAAVGAGRTVPDAAIETDTDPDPDTDTDTDTDLDGGDRPEPGGRADAVAPEDGSTSVDLPEPDAAVGSVDQEDDREDDQSDAEPDATPTSYPDPDGSRANDDREPAASADPAETTSPAGPTGVPSGDFTPASEPAPDSHPASRPGSESDRDPKLEPEPEAASATNGATGGRREPIPAGGDGGLESTAGPSDDGRDGTVAAGGDATGEDASDDESARPTLTGTGEWPSEPTGSTDSTLETGTARREWAGRRAPEGTGEGGTPAPWFESGGSGPADGAEPTVETVPETAVTAVVDSAADLTAHQRRMLAHYASVGTSTPRAAHRAAREDRQGQDDPEGDARGDSEADAAELAREEAVAYGHHRDLRRAGLVRHTHGDRYEYALSDVLEAEVDGRPTDAAVAAGVATVEERVLPDGGDSNGED